MLPWAFPFTNRSIKHMSSMYLFLETPCGGLAVRTSARHFDFDLRLFAKSLNTLIRTTSFSHLAVDFTTYTTTSGLLDIPEGPLTSLSALRSQSH